MKEDDKISVIVPVYKVEDYINKCVESILNQTYKELEIILVDDGSPDNCGILCDKFQKKDERVKVIHKENGGLSDARNAGIDIATGNYITFIDSDDYIDEDYIEFLYKLILENDSDISVCSHRVKYENGTILDKATHNRYDLNSEEALYRILYHKDLDLSAWAKLYKTELFKEVRYPKGRCFEDAATTYKLMDKADKIIVCSESKYNYVIRSSSITTSSFSEKKLDLITSTKEMRDYIVEKYPSLENAANRRLMYAYLSTLTQLFESDTSNLEIQNDLIKYIKDNSDNILRDKEVPLRDKIAIFSIKIGPQFYKTMWKRYKKITGRK